MRSLLDRHAFRAARLAKGLSQADLARLAGVSQQLVGAIEAGAHGSTKFLPRLAAALGVEPARLDPEWARVTVPAPRRLPDGAPLAAEPGVGSARLPIHAGAEAGAGEITVSPDPVDFVPRPSPLALVAGAYGLYVVGESMLPEYRPGDLALVHPHLPIIDRETYVFGGAGERAHVAIIAHLRGADPEAWLVRRWNPPEGTAPEVALIRRGWPKAHRVVGKYARR